MRRKANHSILACKLRGAKQTSHSNLIFKFVSFVHGVEKPLSHCRNDEFGVSETEANSTVIIIVMEMNHNRNDIDDCMFRRNIAQVHVYTYTSHSRRSKPIFVVHFVTLLRQWHA